MKIRPRSSEATWRRKAQAAKRLLRTLRPYNSRLLWLGCSSAASVIAETVALAAIVPLATTVSASRDTASFDGLGTRVTFSTWQLIMLTAFAIGLKLLFGVLNATQDARLLSRYELDQRRRGFRAFLRSTWSRQSDEGPGHLQDILVNVVLRSQTALKSLTAAMNAGAGLAIMLTGAFIAGGVGALAIVLAIGLLVLLLSPVLARSRRHSTQLLTLGRRFAGDLEESTSLARDARVVGVQERFVGRLDETVVPFAHHRMRSLQLVRVSALLFETAGLWLVVGSLSVLYVMQPGSLGDLSVMALLMARGLMYGRQLNNQLQVCSDAVPFVTSLEAAINTYESDVPAGGTVEIDRVDDIVFEGVTYRYGTTTEALQHLDIHIEHGDSVGVIGPSGSGKSTFLQLLLLLREPTTGRVVVNGREASELSQTSWYGHVNLVPQDPRLVKGTILENIRFFRSGLSEEQCIDAATRANIHDEIMAMPAGYATEVGPRGDAVSGGQRQRICIARALVGDPDLIVFDEPTSALDAHSEEAIHQALEALRGQTTLVIVAHRLSTISICDRLMVFREGALEASGPRHEIESQGGYFADVLRISQVV